MLDLQLQERFMRRCADAAFGYTAATTAAYATFADQVLDFWAGVLNPSRRDSAASGAAWSWPVPARQELPSLPFVPFAWAAPRREHAPMGYPFAASYAPFSAWLGMFPLAAPPAAWPMAFMLIASGVPRSVAWPAAEANVAVMDAADAATVSAQQVFSSYRTDGGHSVARQFWPPAHLMMLAALMPLNINAMLATLRAA
jgi:hypothetical protein